MFWDWKLCVTAWGEILLWKDRSFRSPTDIVENKFQCTARIPSSGFWYSDTTQGSSSYVIWLSPNLTLHAPLQSIFHQCRYNGSFLWWNTTKTFNWWYSKLIHTCETRCDDHFYDETRSLVLLLVEKSVRDLIILPYSSSRRRHGNTSQQRSMYIGTSLVEKYPRYEGLHSSFPVIQTVRQWQRNVIVSWGGSSDQSKRLISMK